MKHHWGDYLDRDGDYWTVVPNRERHVYAIGDVPAGSQEITIVTISKDEENWERIFTLPNLEELTLHEPSKQQLLAISKLLNLKRLRITHARPHDLSFISSLENIEELVLEYVSGFSDLSHLKKLKHLKSLHMENLRKVSDFEGLSGIESLRYLCIDGTFDWKQPILNFEFLKGLPNLEVLSIKNVTCKSPYPALMPVIDLTKLKKISIARDKFITEEYALLESALPRVEGADWGAYTIFSYNYLPLPKDDVRYHLPVDVIKSKHPEILVYHDGQRKIPDPEEQYFRFTGKGIRRIRCISPKSIEKCDEYTKKYQLMKEEARELIASIV